MMLKYYVADAFADEVMSGNSAGVCVLDEWLPIEKMARIAAENNLSETAFCVKSGENNGKGIAEYDLRWFTPTCEIDLCGHATFGTAYILFRFYEQNKTEIRFTAIKEGHELNVSKDGEELAMDFPTIVPEPFEYDERMAEAVGAVPAQVMCTERDLILIFDDEETVINMTPDFTKLKELPYKISCYVTAPSDNYDYVTRAFWPKIGINEDPVNGAMYCAMIPYWRERLGKDVQVARQVSARGGTVHGTYCGDGVKIAGRGALYLEGNILIDEK